MILKLKDGVRFLDNAAAISHMTMVVMAVFEANGQDVLRITGGVEDHKHRSLHVYGAALDYGSRWLKDKEGNYWDDERKFRLGKEIESNLGDGFDFFYEEDSGHTTQHFHGEYQPKDWHR